MTDQTKVTLTAEQLAARKLALENANKPVESKPTVGQVANVTATPAPSPANVPPVSAAPVKPVEAPLTDKRVSDLLNTATAALSNGTKGEADTAVAALATAAAKPVDDHKAAIAKANANTGKPAQGGTVTGNRGAPKAATPKVAPVAAAKPEVLGKVATAVAASPDTGGYQLDKWPKVLPAPSKVDIAVANALGTMTREFTKQGLALSFYLSAKAGSVTTNDAAIAFCDVFGGKIDPKLNVINQRLVPSGLGYVVKGSAASVYPGAKRGTTYKAYLTPKGVAAVTKLLDAQKLKVPAYMLPPVEKGGKAPQGVTGTSKGGNATLTA